MESKDVFVTDYEIEAAIDFLHKLEKGQGHELTALMKTMMSNSKTRMSVSACLTEIILGEAGAGIFLASFFYIMGLHTGLARASTKSIEELLGLSTSCSPKEEKE